MSTDDPFARHLNDLANGSPPIEVDHRRVLEAGRRRRAARAGALTIASAVGVVALVTGVAALAREPVRAPASSASSTSTPIPQESDPPAALAVVDESARTIRLPLDDLMLSSQDRAVLDTARDLALSRCMADAGFAKYAPFDGPVRPDPGNERKYGVWIREQVAQYGYQDPTGQAVSPVHAGRRLAVNQNANAASRACVQGLLDQRVMYEPEAIVPQSPVGYRPAVSTDEGRAVIAQWSQCLQDNGVAPPDAESGNLTPAGVDAAPLQEQIRIGLIDVDCKRRLDIVQRLADIDAAEQAAYIERAADFLAAYRAVVQPVLAKDRILLDEAGVVVGPAEP